jgi:toxin ParE1/3/4
VKREHRVENPRHAIVYRVAPDGTVEILGLVHERMALTQAARRMQREAGA